MPVNRPDVIDLMGIHLDTGHFILTIANHLEWDAAGGMLLILQEKINRYLAFVESGEVREHCPDIDARHVRIDVCCRFTPSPDGERFLEQAQRIVEGSRLSFSWRVVRDEVGG